MFQWRHDPSTKAAIAALELRVSVLESERANREMDVNATVEQLTRLLKRVRARQLREDEPARSQADPSQLDLVRARRKFP